MRTFKDVALVAGLTGIIAFTGLTGCSMREGKKARETGRTVTQYKSDEATSDRVADALKTTPVYKFPDVHVHTYEGTVELSGFVQTPAQKQEAERIARQVPGVNRVIDALAVVPATPTPTGESKGYPPVERSHNQPVQQGPQGQQPAAPQPQQQAPAQVQPPTETGPVDTAPRSQ
jgi:hyperosmotically inducible protein